MSHRATGIAALGLQLPSLAMEVGELAGLRGQDPKKYTHGLGCREMALCAPGTTVVDLAVGAAERALERWGGDRRDIGLLALGTESALDMSRPLSAWVADRLGLRGALRSYEVKHACYGGTLALRQALEWRLAGASQGRVALVIAADEALYKPADPGEPTQGAGAVAMLVGEPRVAAFSYGSGFGAELLTLTAGADAAAGAWVRDMERDLEARELVDAAAYERLRSGLDVATLAV